MPNIYGYVRVSSADQCIDRQVIAMRRIGIPEKRIIIDRASGKDFNRPKYRSMVRKLRKGDTLYIHSLDRLGRSYADVPNEWNRLTRSKGVTIKVLDMELLDTDRTRNRIETFLMQIVLMLMSFLAEDERVRNRERQAEGIAAAKARGVTFGRPPKPLPSNFDEIYALWLLKKVSGLEAARRCNMPASTFYYKAKKRRELETA